MKLGWMTFPLENMILTLKFVVRADNKALMISQWFLCSVPFFTIDISVWAHLVAEFYLEWS